MDDIQPLVSVVVPTFNRRQSLRRLLDTLVEQTFPPTQFEVVVVNDGSTDDTVALLRELATPYALRVLEQEHQGPAEARNLGVRQAQGELIVFLDDDVVPRPDLIERHVAAHRNARDQSGSVNLVVIGPMLPPQHWRRPPWVRWEEALLEAQYRDMLAGKYTCGPRQFYTANASLPRATLLAAGGFDAGFKRAEDVEFAYRLRDLGAYFAFEPAAEVLHYAWRSFEAWSRIPYQYGRYDVVMHREKGHEALPCAFVEYHQRHQVTRALVRACLGRPWLARGAVLGLRGVAEAADRAGARGAARLALSGIFNLLYWQGVCDEFGGRDAVWREIEVGASKHHPGIAWSAAPQPASAAGHVG